MFIPAAAFFRACTACRRTIQAITGERDGLPTCPSNDTNRLDCAYPDLGVHDTNHIFFVEPSAIRNILDFSPQNFTPVSNYSQVVHTVHTVSQQRRVAVAFCPCAH